MRLRDVQYVYYSKYTTAVTMYLRVYISETIRSGKMERTYRLSPINTVIAHSGNG